MNSPRNRIAGTLAVATALVCCAIAQPAFAGPPFDPSIDATVDGEANTSTGLDFVLELPQNDDPDGLATSHLKKAIVALPPAMTVDPSTASNLQSCSSTQIRLKTNFNPTCPANSALGTVRVTTPVLDDELTGKIYLATPYDNPFNNLISLYIVVGSTERGILIKLPGRVNIELGTGKITTVFDDNPQLPFDHLFVNLETPNGGPLVNPNCGTYAVQGTLFSWSQPNVPVPLSAPFSVNGNCSGARSDTLSLSGTTALNRAVTNFRKAAKKRKKHRAKRARRG